MEYGLLGSALYYYLTRDNDVLNRIILAKKYILREYWNDILGELRWIKRDFIDEPDAHKYNQRKLVAQLDQINAYMMLLTTILPSKEMKEEWTKYIIRLSNAIEKFYDPENNLFWGRLEDEEKRLGGHHVDFGRTIKSFWMLHLIERKFGIKVLTQWTGKESILDKASRVLEEAFIIEENTWGEKKLDHGVISKDKVWWIHAELTKMAATIGLQHNSEYICRSRKSFCMGYASGWY